MALFSIGREASDQAGRICELEGVVAAIQRSQAVIEFNLDGGIITANDNFLKTMGYGLGDIQGRSHSLFVEPGFAASADYREFWRRLNAGEFLAGKFRRLGKGGREVWIQATYNPVFDRHGKLTKIIKFATDITEIEIERLASERERDAVRQEQDEVVTALADSLQRLAQGDLTARIDAQFDERYARLKADFNAAVDSLKDAMG
ncbi:MAG: PAS domain-containing protein, partial [Caulobacter sp.]